RLALPPTGPRCATKRWNLGCTSLPANQRIADARPCWYGVSRAHLNWGKINVDLSPYVLEAHRRDEEFVLYRGEASNGPGSPSVFLLAPTSIQPTSETLKKMEYHSLRDELDSAWAVRSRGLCEHGGQMTLVLEDPGGETLD